MEQWCHRPVPLLPIVRHVTTLHLSSHLIVLDCNSYLRTACYCNEDFHGNSILLVLTILFASHGLAFTTVLSLIYNMGKDLQITYSENLVPVDNQMGKWKYEQCVCGLQCQGNDSRRLALSLFKPVKFADGFS